MVVRQAFSLCKKGCGGKFPVGTIGDKLTHETKCDGKRHRGVYRKREEKDLGIELVQQAEPIPALWASALA